jgi:catechol 2,3-dioxygenase-like lactoylglutathione lyase family enzyme
MELALVILAVTDVARSATFYRRALGWDQVEDVAVYAELRSASGMRLGLYEREAYALNTGAPAPSGSADVPTGTELYCHTDDVEGAIARLQSEGAALLSPLTARAWGDEAAYLCDLDGNVVVVARATEGARATS